MNTINLATLESILYYETDVKITLTTFFDIFQKISYSFKRCYLVSCFVFQSALICFLFLKTHLKELVPQIDSQIASRNLLRTKLIIRYMCRSEEKIFLMTD